VRSLTASRLAAGSRSATVDSGCRAQRRRVARPPRSQIRRGCRDATTDSLRRAGRRLAVRRNDDRPWFSSVSPTDSTPRVLSTVATACRLDPRSPAAVPSGFGRWHLRGAVWCEPSGSHRDLGPSSLVGATSSEVTFRDRVGSATRAPILGVRPGRRRLAGGRQVWSRSEGIGHRWLAGGERPRGRQPSVTSRRCGSERVGRRGGADTGIDRLTAVVKLWSGA